MNWGCWERGGGDGLGAGLQQKGKGREGKGICHIVVVERGSMTR